MFLEDRRYNEIRKEINSSSGSLKRDLDFKSLSKACISLGSHQKYQNPVWTLTITTGIGPGPLDCKSETHRMRAGIVCYACISMIYDTQDKKCALDYIPEPVSKRQACVYNAYVVTNPSTNLTLTLLNLDVK